jgi:hypothetical protein
VTPLSTFAITVLVLAQTAPGPPLTIGRLHYDGGGDWYANPSSLPNLIAAVNQRTSVRLQEQEHTVRLTDPTLWDIPYLYMTGHGDVRFAPDEAQALRRYLEQGGFLHVDDNYGLDESFRRAIAEVFPDRSLIEVPLDHAIYHIVYEFPDGVPKIHEHDGLPAQGFGIFVDGRLALFYSYQSDLGDGWEDATVHGDPDTVREAALRMGVNLVAYAVAVGR